MYWKERTPTGVRTAPLCFASQRLCFALKTPWSDGTRHLLLSPMELLEKLAALLARVLGADLSECAAAVRVRGLSSPSFAPGALTRGPKRCLILPILRAEESHLYPPEGPGLGVVLDGGQDAGAHGGLGMTLRIPGPRWRPPQ